jgi:hypothetical protein
MPELPSTIVTISFKVSRVTADRWLQVARLEGRSLQDWIRNELGKSGDPDFDEDEEATPNNDDVVGDHRTRG